MQESSPAVNRYWLSGYSLDLLLVSARGDIGDEGRRATGHVNSQFMIVLQMKRGRHHQSRWGSWIEGAEARLRNQPKQPRKERNTKERKGSETSKGRDDRPSETRSCQSN
jgi:hypothetical protein